MKPLGFLVSLLLHLLFLLLVMHLRFPMPPSVPMPQVIQIVPMAPPPSVLRQIEPPLVYVRPFVLKGGGKERTVGMPRGEGRRLGREGDLVPRGATRAAAPAPTVSSAPEIGGRKEPEPAPGVRPVQGDGGHLAIDMERIARSLRDQSRREKESAAGDFAAGPGAGSGLSFGEDAPGAGDIPGGGGDGTASTARGGNAFFATGGYDITPWAQRMIYRVKRNWIFPPVSAYGVKGEVGIYVLIDRDGGIGRIFIRKASGIRPYDQAAFNAIRLSAPLPPLPEDFPLADLQAYIVFYYN